MKETILVKQCPAIQLAHLYEHLFCAEVDKLFYANGIFPYLDYSLTGNTHQSGIIYIKLVTYTDVAADQISTIESIGLPLTDESVAIAASQLIAENEHAYVSSGIEVVKEHLRQLDDIGWSNLDAVTSIDTKGTKRVAKPLFIDTDHSLPAKKLYVSIDVDEKFNHDKRHLLPLLRLVCFVLSDTYETILSDNFGFYPTEGAFKNAKHTVGYESKFNLPNGDDTSKSDILKAAVDTIRYIYNHNGFERFVNEVANISYRHLPTTAPNALHNLTDTGIIQGSLGWHEISSMKNIEIILKDLTVSVKIGNDKISNKLALLTQD